MLKNANILIVDDDEGVTDLLSAGLEESEGYHCFAVSTGEHALEKLSSSNIDLMLLDLRLPGISGIDVLTKAKRAHPDTLIIVITGVGDVQTAVEAMKLGATDYITKPFDITTVANSIESALQEGTRSGSKLFPVGFHHDLSDKTSRWAACMDSIARGVEMRFESLVGTTITQTIVDRTVATAQSMGVPENHINQWLNSRKQ
ncbi:MAG TPA: response regulator [Dehalococcoidia bacterium]|nr:response regulator [Dehalococcoidia bacterium]